MGPWTMMLVQALASKVTQKNPKVGGIVSKVIDIAGSEAPAAAPKQTAPIQAAAPGPSPKGTLAGPAAIPQAGVATGQMGLPRPGLASPGQINLMNSRMGQPQYVQPGMGLIQPPHTRFRR